MRKIIYLLIEDKGREFGSRLLIALNAIANGFDVVLGQQWAIAHSLETLPPGVVLFKGNNLPQARDMANAKARGHLVASIEEEAYALIDERLILSGYDTLAIHFAQGQFQAEIVSKNLPRFEGKIVISGNPRSELLQPHFNKNIHTKAQDIRHKIGPYILVSTNVGTINNKEGDALWCYDLFCRTGFYDKDDESQFEQFLDACDWEKGNLKSTTQIVRALS